MKGLALASFVWVAAHSGPSPAAAADLEEGITLYWSGRYEETVEVLTLARREALRTDEEIECLKYLAFSYVAIGENDKARDAFGELLASDPHHVLDETLVSPKILRQLDSARTELVESLFAEGKASYFEKDYRATRDTMTRVLALVPGHELAKEYDQLAAEQEGLIERAAALEEPLPPPMPEAPAAPEPDNVVYRQTGEITPAVLVSRVAPEYPIAARRAGEEGTVIATLVIDASGQVREAKIVRSVSPSLDEATLEAVRSWLYRPALRNGQPVAVYSVLRLEFKLDH